MLTGCLPQMNIYQGHSKPKLPKYLHKVFKEKKQPTDLKKKCRYPKQVILKLYFHIFIAGVQRSVVAKIFRIILFLLKMQ